jgi:cell fate (sporulation/competence/biofilm development) regulator YlbF (YheA/YmcA/DUF963 family)
MFKRVRRYSIMNVYDEAHNLARAIRESGEFREFDRMRQEIEADKESSEMLKEFQTLQVQLQAAQMTGEQPDADLMGRIQSLSTMLATKPLAARYLQTQAAFTIMMNDVFKIIGESVGL